MASTVEPALDGLYQYLTTTPGLTSADGVTVRSGDVGPAEIGTGDYIVFGALVGILETREGLARRPEQITVSGHVAVVRPGGDEPAIQTTRARVGQLYGLLRAAVEGIPTSGAIPSLGGLSMTASSLTQTPAVLAGGEVAGRRAERAFTLTWTSDT